MSLITAKGSQAKENAQKSGADLKEIYLRLAENGTHKVRLLSAEDYVEYQASGDFNLGIYQQAISGPTSPLVIAHQKGGETFKGLYTKPRYVFVFASLETGKLVAFDASKTQAKALISTIEDYADSLDEFAFTFKRTGTKTDTTYSLNLIPKLKGKELEAFNALNGQEVEMAFFEQIVQPKDDNFLIKLLAEVDSAVLALFPDYVPMSDLDESAEPVEDGSLGDPRDQI